ncbi:MAG: outer membrane protein assembly factor BamB [Gammaproteobacteria bacterium]|nr:outer membrane protein assembly factor BamB [Gammaproteobacteria bacterium]MDH3534225.1 outer membrane protein assembly factor BamB [Gammaproteobacteria bacterium]
MKLAVRLVTPIMLALLAACSGGQDNSEPPAPLTDIDDEIALTLNWKLDTRAAANRASYRLRPLLLGNRVYSIDTGGTVVCVDVASGKRLWRYDTELAAITGLGGDERMLIATSQDGDIAAYRNVDKGMEILWRTRIDSEIRATPVVDAEQVFVRSVDGKLRSLAASDGRQQWVVSGRVPSLSLTGNSEPLVRGELVFAGFDDGKLVAYDRSRGQVRWESTISLPAGRTEVERLVDLDGSFVLRDGVIYVVSYQGRLAAVQAVSGDLLWSRQFSSFQSIAIDDDALYLSADNSDIWSIDRRTGTAFWKQDVLHARKITAPSIIDDKLVVADLDGYLHWFDKADGKLLGRLRVTDSRNYVQPLAWRASVLTLDKSGLLASVSLQQ